MKKYLPYIIGYSIYASIVLIAIADERGHHFWEPFIAWLITIPLIVGSVSYFILKHYRKSNLPSKEEPLFIENWPLLDFAKEYGPKMQIGTFTNNTTGEKYKSCIFTQRDGTITYVEFYSKLGELTPSEISKRKEELKVGVTSSNKLYLHNEDVDVWETINL